MALAVAIPTFGGGFLFCWLLLNHPVVFVILFLLGIMAYLTRSAYKFLKKKEGKTMKTIKERAEAIANDVLRKVNKKAEEDGGFVAPQYYGSVRNLIVASYIRGAEDQRGIDIEEFHPIMEENVLKAINKQKQIDIEKACEWWYSRCDNLGISRYQIELFKKAMEGGEV